MRIPHKSEKLDLEILRTHLDKLNLDKNEDLNFWIYCKVAIHTGLRYIDIANLKHSDYNHTKKELSIIEKKTKKVSVIPFDLPQITKHFIPNKTGFVIYSEKYKTKISLMTINRRLKKLYSSDFAISSHSIRKATASLVYTKSGNNIYTTMEFLNHNSIETTRKYLSLSETERKQIFEYLK